jgi:Domain of unknown function (DUF4351)
MNAEQRRLLLADFVEAHLPLDDAQKREMEALLATEKYAEVRAMNKTHFEKGEEQGRRDALREIIEARFGALSAAVDARLKEMPLAELKELAKALLKAQSLADLGLDK